MSPVHAVDDKTNSNTPFKIENTAKVFNEALQTLARDPPIHVPLRDETHRILNTYYAKGTVQSALLTEPDRGSRELWPAKAKKEEPRPMDCRRTEEKGKKSPLASRETIKDRPKKIETGKGAPAPKRSVGDPRPRMDRGDFGRFLDFK